MSGILSLEEYGPLLRAAYATLHGGHPEEMEEAEAVRPQEAAAAFLARTRAESLEGLLSRVSATRPPPELQAVHDALRRLLAAAVEADRALAAQVEAYSRGEWEVALRHAERVSELVTTSARLDRDLILALRAAEAARPGTLTTLALLGVVLPRQMD